MLLSHKLFVGFSIIIFTMLFQGFVITNYSLFPTLNLANKWFTTIFPFIILGFFWAILEQARLKVKTILKIFLSVVFLNVLIAYPFAKYSGLSEIYMAHKYKKLDDDFLKANPAVVNLESYQNFKKGMETLDPFAYDNAKQNYYNIKSVDEYMSDLIRITTNNSNISELKVKLAEIDDDHYISVAEYLKFIEVVKTLPVTKETEVYRTIYYKIR